MKRIIWRRLIEFCKSDIFCVIMGLSDNFTVRAPKCRCDGKHCWSSKERWFWGLFFKLAVLWVVIWLSQNSYTKDSKMLLTWYAQIEQRKTVNKTPVTLFCKFAIFWATMGFGAVRVRVRVRGFTLRAPKCRPNDQQQNSSWKRWFRGVWKYFANWSSFRW